MCVKLTTRRENMENLLMVIKKDNANKHSITVTTGAQKRVYYDKDLDDIMLVELSGLDFKRDDLLIGRLENLQALIKKGFNIRIYETDRNYKLKVTYYSLVQGGTEVIDTEILKPEGMPTLLENADSMAEDLIDQFNSDNENSL